MQSGYRVPPRVLNSLFHLQDSLNAAVHPNWRETRRPDDWALAITMESSELIDSYPWKWWKSLKAPADMQNVKIEIADILHFSLSGEMQKRTGDPKLCKNIPLQTMKEQGFFCRPPTDAGTTAASGQRTGNADKNELFDLIFFPLTNVDNAVATFRNIILLASIYRFDLITDALILVARDLDFSLVGYYVAKYTLNHIRQMKGYKEGVYVKVRDGVEDNVLLHDCVQAIPMDELLNEETYLETWIKIASSVFDAFEMPEGERQQAYNGLKSAALERKQ
ncbi:deoxyuridine triphosphatase [Trypanosoma rangeli]|uniref:Deoxyuridine triphosphatase n=1 Tax=Trypanosoma rangeli TaxID=5698 RepID=A0A422NGY7_TRYRA|nr:deoxyuridine triphosphatase [Trypanosoma rangeli]RNF04721.1 deoxyuridine triphosphatase [Trypanosoma rangeli]|eukprot:RNF04721.1 deoxyuridine triphosphatase [Trypanosoma rangeli]